MKKNIQIIALITILMSMVLHMISCNTEKNKTIDMTGNNDVWRASLNINMGYDNELVIKLVTEEFDPPSKIIVDVLAKEKSVYSDNLKIIEDDFPHSGIYKRSFGSVRYLEKNYKDVSIVVVFNDESIIISLDSIEIIE